MTQDELAALLSRISAATRSRVTAEDLAERLSRDRQQLLRQPTCWWQFRRRRYIDCEVRANQEFIRAMQQVVE